MRCHDSGGCVAADDDRDTASYESEHHGADQLCHVFLDRGDVKPVCVASMQSVTLIREAVRCCPGHGQTSKKEGTLFCDLPLFDLYIGIRDVQSMKRGDGTGEEWGYVYKTIEYALYPSPTQRKALEATLSACGSAYNRILAECKADALEGVPQRSYESLTSLLPGMKAADPKYKVPYAQCLLDVCKRVVRAMSGCKWNGDGDPEHLRGSSHITDTTRSPTPRRRASRSRGTAFS